MVAEESPEVTPVLLLLSLLVFSVRISLMVYPPPSPFVSSLRHFYGDVQWIICNSGVGFQVPPEDMFIASVVPLAVEAFYAQIVFKHVRYSFPSPPQLSQFHYAAFYSSFCTLRYYMTRLIYDYCSLQDMKEGDFVKKAPKLGVDRALCLRASLGELA